MWCRVRKHPLVQFDFAPCGPSSVTPDGVPPSPEGEGIFGPMWSSAPTKRTDTPRRGGHWPSVTPVRYPTSGRAMLAPTSAAHPMPSPGGKVPSVSEADEECGRRPGDKYTVSGFFPYPTFRRSSPAPFGGTRELRYDCPRQSCKLGIRCAEHHPRGRV